MSKKLLIVESPSKAKTIGKYLGKDFAVQATVGHIRDLPKNKLGVDLENNFEPEYINMRGKADVIKKLKSAAKKAEEILIATDPDREGEAIAFHISEILGSNTIIKRVLFNEITKAGIQSGLDSPLALDLNKVNAQQARRIMDRLVGYQVSPFLWKSLTYGLSAGRVQSVALRIICEREAEIKKVVAELSTESEIDCGISGKVKCPVCLGQGVIIREGTFGNEYTTCPFSDDQGKLTCEEFNLLIRGKLKPKIPVN